MIQEQFISYVLNSKDSSIIELNNLDEGYFSDYKAEFGFIRAHMDRYHSIPDKETFLASFPDFELIDVREPSSYLLEELFKDYQTKRMASTFNRIRPLLIEGDVEKAMSIYKADSETLSTGVALSCVDIMRDTSRYDAYLERTKDYSKYYISTGFTELDKLIGGIDREEELGVVVARTNIGKCLSKGTKVLLANGVLKNVEDIEVGDQVQSLNRVNTVLALHHGVSNGYRIIPNRGEPFTVSANHILTILQLKEHWDSARKQMVTENDFEMSDISVEDYLKLSNHKKHLSKLFCPKVDYQTKQQTIPPYILGVWLGDGTCKEPSITTMDDEIREELSDYAKSIGVTLTEYHEPKGKARTYSLSGRNGKFLKLLRGYNLINNKHIPLEYLTGDRNQRLELLAGIVDTDGYLMNSQRGVEIVQKSKELSEQLVQLVRGLGFKTSGIVVKHNNKYNRDYYRFTFYGELSLIPTRLPRKQLLDSSHRSKLSVTGFKVEPVERVEYYGFMADGDHRYIMSNGIITHNTWILLKMAVSAAMQGLNVGLYSGEMSERKVGYRVDTILGKFSNGAIIHGNAGISQQYRKYLDELPGKCPGSLKVLTPKMINGSAGVNALRMFIEKEKLDILFIDQLSLLEDDRKARVPYEKAANISKDLKNLQVMKRIPIISVSQQNRTKNEDAKDDSIDTTQLAMSDRIAQDATFILGITRDKKDNSIMSIHVVKSRDSANGQKLTYVVDLNKGQWTFVPEEDENGKPSDGEPKFSQSAYQKADEPEGEEVF
jgi:replicative DNA helicase